MTRYILAAYDDEGIDVYQAYNTAIAKAALEKGTFGGGGFKIERMTWIKPSFGWMLYRAGYGLKPDQEVILKIKLTHAGFQQVLGWAVESTWNPALFDTEDAWKKALQESPVRVQWDPDRSIEGERLERRAIQIGLRGEAVRAYVHDWIVSITDVTPLAHQIEAQVRSGEPVTVAVPEERIYPVNEALALRLGLYQI